MECFSAAQGAATAIFKIIDRTPKIDAMSPDGAIINYGIKGDLEFENVSFSYPSRPDVQVLFCNLKKKTTIYSIQFLDFKWAQY